MEDFGNIFEKQVINMSKTKVKKPPTRLQKHAPASLQLDQMKADAASAATATARTSPFEAAATPIPLLTPLVLSPNPFQETEEEFVFPTDHDKKTGWKNPGGGVGYVVEASTLFGLFQNKCVLVNDAQ